jgi:tetratricopeptide (TPR) repeat protein
MRKALVIGVFAAVAAGIPAAAQQTQAAPAQPAQKTRGFKSPAEQKALQDIFGAPTPEARITAVDDFVTKFANSDFQGLALYAATQASAQKNDYDKVIIYGERALAADPDDPVKLETMTMLAKTIGQRVRERDLDLEEKLGQVEKYCNTALDMLKTMAKPNPQMTDDKWELFKGQMAADAHEALGIDALVRKNFDLAIKEFKSSLEVTKEPDPTAAVRLAQAYNRAGKYDEAIAVCDKLMADANLHPTLKQYAQSERARAVVAKSKAAAAPAGAAAAAPAPSSAPAPAPAPKP